MKKITSLLTIAVLAAFFCFFFEDTSAGGLNACHLPKNEGECYADIPAYWYNLQRKECEEFSYGGCRGNANNFKTKEECEAACAN
ncbi:unnamed protein product [Orchesella dallaii]|uniref:BPTI/Kunitz inhibitor domain-containing protein n=1 Tax=Orchesella dallaii TaxID=48710 RepID=A0ABP1R4S0_9HEXA